MKKQVYTQKKPWEIISRRRFFIAILICLQLLFFVYIILNTSQSSSIIGRLFPLLSMVVALYVVNKKDKDAYKLTWVFLILLLPVFGGLFYLLFTAQTSSKKTKKKLAEIEIRSRELFLLSGNYFEEACKITPRHVPQLHYLQEYAGFPVYHNTDTHYLSPGRCAFEQLLIDLQSAQEYIFLEFFIINKGFVWDSVLNILIEKAKQGVTIRVIYDDIGSIFYLPQNYPKELEKYGIHCVAFNLFRPFITTHQNNRDHRKIVSIDGKIAFTGGLNLSDEYINIVDRFGHWKDAVIKIEGEAAWSFAILFLQMWELCSSIPEDYSAYYPWKNQACPIRAKGLVQPYADNPMDTENIGEHVYLQIINTAKEYVYIVTPYLIVGNNILSALRLAAKSGIDLRIITPHRGDKPLVHATTRSYYRRLIQSGVKIYEYSQGFIHSKTFVSDDSVATVGTTNLDFRSLYLHFECGTWLYETESVMEIKKDFLDTLEKCQQITEKECKVSFLLTIIQDILRLFAPLM